MAKKLIKKWIAPMSTVAIRAALDDLHDLPASVRNWRVESGPDATGVDAVWVWVTLRDEDLDKDTRATVREIVREAVRRVAEATPPWVYVRFRAESEATDD